MKARLINKTSKKKSLNEYNQIQIYSKRDFYTCNNAAKCHMRHTLQFYRLSEEQRLHVELLLVVSPVKAQLPIY
jgi:hypothetical protein